MMIYRFESIRHRVNWRAMLVSMMAMIMLGTMFLPPGMPVSTAMAFGGESQKLDVTYDMNDDGTPESVETWNVVATDNGDGTYDNTTTYMSWTDPVTLPGGGSGAASSGPYRDAGGNTANLAGSVVTRDQTDQRTIKSISTQFIPAYGVNNTATVTNTYTPGTGDVMFPLATGNSWQVQTSSVTSLLGPAFGWDDTFDVAVTGPVTTDIAGQPLSVPCYQIAWTWMASTMPPIIGVPPSLPLTCFYEYWADSEQSIEPLVQIDQQHFTGTEYRNSLTSQVSFSSASYSVNEDAGTATIEVVLSEPAPINVTVDYATSDGSANQPDDYTTVSDTLTFVAGDISETFEVPIIDDGDLEGSEDLNLTLVNSVGATLVSTSTAVLTIVDNEVAQVIFSSANYAVNEGDGTANIEIILTQASLDTVTVDYATSDGTANQPGDYTVVSDTLTFVPGDISETFAIPIIDDGDLEDSEDLNLTLSNPGNALLGSPNPAVLTIVDNDCNSQTWHFTDDSASGQPFEMDKNILRQADRFMSKTGPTSGTGNNAIINSLNTVYWWYVDERTWADMVISNSGWEASIVYSSTDNWPDGGGDGILGNLSCKLYKLTNAGVATLMAEHALEPILPAQDHATMAFDEMVGTGTTDFNWATGDRLAIQLVTTNIELFDNMTVYFNSTTYDGTLTSSCTFPDYPFPAGDTIQVDMNDAGCVTSSGQPDPYSCVYCNIQDALDDAVPGDDVIVADGIYTGDRNRDLSMAGEAINLHSANGPDNCVIDVQGSDGSSHRGFSLHSGEGELSIVDGFTIQNGWVEIGQYGGGMYLANSSPTIKNCIIRNNRADGGDPANANHTPRGGGAYLLNSSATITDTVFLNNLSKRVVGILVPFTFPAVYYWDGYGGGLEIEGQTSTPVITNCSFIGNQAMSNGGAMYNWFGASPIVTNCTFFGNVAGREGRQTVGNEVNGSDVYSYFWFGPPAPVFTNCIFWGGSGDDTGDVIENISDRTGGGAWTSAYSTVGYSDVQTGWSGAGGSTVISANPQVANMPIRYGITDAAGTSAVTIVVRDAGMYSVGDIIEIGDDGVARTVVNAASTHVSFHPALASASLIDTFVANWGPGATDMDEDWHLKGGVSPCVDSADNSALSLPPADFEGDARVIDADNDGTATVDMGADEAQYIATATVNISMTLQGSARPDPAGWEIPVTIEFFEPGSDPFIEPAVSSGNLTTTKSGAVAICQATGIVPGIYDITAVSEHTLMNIKRNVVVSAPDTSVDMGILLEGNCNDDNVIDLSDFNILIGAWLGFDPRADFNRDGIVDLSDFNLLITNWLMASPIDV